MQGLNIFEKFISSGGINSGPMLYEDQKNVYSCFSFCNFVIFFTKKTSVIYEGTCGPLNAQTLKSKTPSQIILGFFRGLAW